MLHSKYYRVYKGRAETSILSIFPYLYLSIFKVVSFMDKISSSPLKIFSFYNLKKVKLYSVIPIIISKKQIIRMIDFQHAIVVIHHHVIVVGVSCILNKSRLRMYMNNKRIDIVGSYVINPVFSCILFKVKGKC